MLISASKLGPLYYINYPDLSDYYSVTDNTVAVNHLELNTVFMVFSIAYQNNTGTLYKISTKSIINHYPTCDNQPPSLTALPLYPQIYIMGTSQGVFCAFIIPTKALYTQAQILNGYPFLGSQAPNAGVKGITWANQGSQFGLMVVLDSPTTATEFTFIIPQITTVNIDEVNTETNANTVVGLTYTHHYLV